MLPSPVAISAARMWAVLWLASLAPASCQALLHFAVIGDPGTGKADQLAVAEQMEIYHQKFRWEFILSLGDNVYERGNPKDFERKFRAVYKNLTDRGARFHSTLGNHDLRTDGGKAQLADPYFGYVGGQDEYVFEAGPVIDGKKLVRFICLNSCALTDALKNKSSSELTSRLSRLDKWLAESGRYHWNILFQHHPLYSYVRGVLFLARGHGPEIELRNVLEPKIAGRIDAVFAGHEHFYQKIRPQKGVHHVISGAAGKVRRGVDTRHPDVESAAERHHFLNVELSRNEMSYQAVAASGEVIDSRIMKK